MKAFIGQDHFSIQTVAYKIGIENRIDIYLHTGEEKATGEEQYYHFLTLSDIGGITNFSKQELTEGMKIVLKNKREMETKEKEKFEQTIESAWKRLQND